MPRLTATELLRLQQELQTIETLARMTEMFSCRLCLCHNPLSTGKEVNRCQRVYGSRWHMDGLGLVSR